MKIAIYSAMYEPSIGGIETFVKTVSAELCGRHDVAVITKTASRESHTDQHDGPGPKVVRMKSLADLVRWIRWADVIQVNGPAVAPMIVCLVFRRRFVVVHHGYQACCPNGMLLRLPGRTLCPDSFMRLRINQCLGCVGRKSLRSLAVQAAEVAWTILRRALCYLADVNVGVSTPVCNTIRLPASRVVLHGTPVTTESLDMRGPHERPAKFCFVGRLVQEKGINVLLETVWRLREVGIQITCEIVGDGPLRSKYEQYVVDMGMQEHVFFLGSRQGAALDSVVRSAVAVVIPSIWSEPAGLVALECLALGTPVIASRIGGLSEIVAEPSLMFEAGNSQQLAERIKAFLMSDAEVLAAGRRACERVRNEMSVEHSGRLHEAVLLGLHHGNA